MKYQIIIREKTLEFDVIDTSEGYDIQFNDALINMDCARLTGNSFSLILNDRSFYLTITEHEIGLEITVDQKTDVVKIKDETQILLEKFGSSDMVSNHAGEIHAPIPGLISKIFHKKGDHVDKGDKLFILEAMKMENEIVSPVTGTVKNVYIKIHTSVEKNDLLINIEVEN